jgi:hypothetical protein
MSKTGCWLVTRRSITQTNMAAIIRDINSVLNKLKKKAFHKNVHLTTKQNIKAK